MRLPILVGARPQFIQSTPVVRLSPGNWRISVTGLIDSVFSLHRDNLQVPFGEPVVGDCTLQVKFNYKGKEDALTIYAEKV
jgi:hypothetical protein